MDDEHKERERENRRCTRRDERGKSGRLTPSGAFPFPSPSPRSSFSSSPKFIGCHVGSLTCSHRKKSTFQDQLVQRTIAVTTAVAFYRVVVRSGWIRIQPENTTQWRKEKDAGWDNERYYSLFNGTNE